MTDRQNAGADGQQDPEGYADAGGDFDDDVLLEENWDILHRQAATLADPAEPHDRRAAAAAVLGESIANLQQENRREYMEYSGNADIGNLAALIRESHAMGGPLEPLLDSFRRLLELRETTARLSVQQFRSELHGHGVSLPGMAAAAATRGDHVAPTGAVASEAGMAAAHPSLAPPLPLSGLEAHLRASLDSDQALPHRVSGFERLSMLLRQMPADMQASFLREQGNALAYAAADMVDRRAELTHATADASLVPVELAAHFLQDIADLARQEALSQADIVRALDRAPAGGAPPGSPLDRLLDLAGTQAADRGGLTATVVDLVQQLPAATLGDRFYHWVGRLDQVRPAGATHRVVPDDDAVAELANAFEALDRSFRKYP